MIDRNAIEDIGKKYFNAYENKDITVLDELFDENIQLTDPFNK